MANFLVRNRALDAYFGNDGISIALLEIGTAVSTADVSTSENHVTGNPDGTAHLFLVSNTFGLLIDQLDFATAWFRCVKGS